MEDEKEEKNIFQHGFPPDNNIDNNETETQLYLPGVSILNVAYNREQEENDHPYFKTLLVDPEHSSFDRSYRLPNWLVLQSPSQTQKLGLTSFTNPNPRPFNINPRRILIDGEWRDIGRRQGQVPNFGDFNNNDNYSYLNQTLPTINLREEYKDAKPRRSSRRRRLR